MITIYSESLFSIQKRFQIGYLSRLPSPSLILRLYSYKYLYVYYSYKKERLLEDLASLSTCSRIFVRNKYYTEVLANYFPTKLMIFSQSSTETFYLESMPIGIKDENLSNDQSRNHDASINLILKERLFINRP